MFLVKTRDGRLFELEEIKVGEWMIKNDKGEKKKVIRFGNNLSLQRGVPIFVEHKDKEISTPAIVDIFKRI
ncbi:MAG: hypothetical protein Q8Q35_03090 [Nanoarchaeota archaeon]|nr:hypothetical protein [Nanoarchaeota archaeon]